MLWDVHMKKLVGNFFLVFTIFCTATVSASSLGGKAVYCERDKGAIKISGQTIGSAVGVHFITSQVLSVHENSDRRILFDETYTALNDKISWSSMWTKFTLDRRSLELKITTYFEPIRVFAYGCELVSPDMMKTKLEESRKRETAGNKL